VAVLDNLSAPEVTGVCKARATRQAQVFYLPPSSPDIEPDRDGILHKALLGQAPARTADALVNRIGSLLDHLLPTECSNIFHAAGYQRSTCK
jgi:hypothetical protein